MPWLGWFNLWDDRCIPCHPRKTRAKRDYVIWMVLSICRLHCSGMDLKRCSGWQASCFFFFPLCLYRPGAPIHSNSLTTRLFSKQCTRIPWSYCLYSLSSLLPLALHLLCHFQNVMLQDLVL